MTELNRLFRVFTVLLTSSAVLLAQQSTTTVQTPFGPTQIPATQAPQQQTPAPPVPAQQAPPPPAQPAPQQTPNAAQDDGSSPVQLHLNNQDVRQVIQIIGNALGLNYIIDPAVKGTVDVNTSETLHRSDLLPILESILKINGATMIRTGNFYQIVPANTAIKQPIEVINQRAATTPDDQVVMQIIRMKFVTAAEMSKILTPYLSEAGNVVVHETGNIILLSDRRSNIRKLLDIVDIFDAAAFQGERVRLLAVKNNRARDVIEDLKTIFNGYAMSEKQSAIRFIAIDRLNSIMVVTPNPDVFPEVQRWLTNLDQPVALAGIQNFVYKVKNARASDLQKVLAELYGYRTTPATQAGGLNPANRSSSTTAGAGSLNTANANAAPPSAGAGLPAQPLVPLAGAEGSTLSATSIRIIADETNNALVIQATPQEYAGIERTLTQLDVLRRQVLIDAEVFEVVLDNNLSFGITAALQARGTLANPLTIAKFDPAVAAQTFAFIGRTRELVAFLNASENRSKVKTLSAPSVLVSDNSVASFEVGAEVPVPTSSSVTPVQSGGTNLFAQTIDFRNTGVILQVKPQINESGNVTMDVSQEISEATPNTISAIVAPVIGKSSVNSTIVVEDGQTIALGGFIRENNNVSKERVPVVGRIPILGALLGNTATDTSRTELIVLITPHVLHTHADADLATDEFKSKLKEMKNLLK